MKHLYRELDLSLQGLELENYPEISLEDLEEALPILELNIDLLHGDGHFQKYRIPVMIYLGDTYLSGYSRELWYENYQLHVTKKEILEYRLSISPESSEDEIPAHSWSLDKLAAKHGSEEENDDANEENDCANEENDGNSSDSGSVCSECMLDLDDHLVPSDTEIMPEITWGDLVDGNDELQDNLPEKKIEIKLPKARIVFGSIDKSSSSKSKSKSSLAGSIPCLKRSKGNRVFEIYDQDYQFYQQVHLLDKEMIDLIYHHNYDSNVITDIGYTQDYIEERFNYWKAIPQHPQKSDAWLKQRTNCITASALADSLGHKGKTARHNLLLNKVSRGEYRTFFGNFYTDWGEKYEDVANAIYCYRYQCEVYEFGLIPHPKYRCLGASTDGISDKLINLEIKCPPTRKITGIIPKHYWMQIQLQLEVLNLPLSHFLECRIEEYGGGAEEFYDRFYEPSTHLEKGIVIEVLNRQRLDANGQPKKEYIYSPVDLCQSHHKMHAWWKSQVENILATDSQLIYITDYYWYLEEYSCINVQRDFKWFQAQLPKIFEFWEEVDHGREIGMEKIQQKFEAEKMPVTEVVSVEPCLLDDSDASSEDGNKSKSKSKSSDTTSNSMASQTATYKTRRKGSPGSHTIQLMKRPIKIKKPATSAGPEFYYQKSGSSNNKSKNPQYYYQKSASTLTATGTNKGKTKKSKSNANLVEFNLVPTKKSLYSSSSSNRRSNNYQSPLACCLDPDD